MCLANLLECFTTLAVKTLPCVQMESFMYHFLPHGLALGTTEKNQLCVLCIPSSDLPAHWSPLGFFQSKQSLLLVSWSFFLALDTIHSSISRSASCWAVQTCWILGLQGSNSTNRKLDRKEGKRQNKIKKKTSKRKKTTNNSEKVFIIFLIYFPRNVSINYFSHQSLFDKSYLYQCLQVIQQKAFSSLLLLIKFFQLSFFPPLLSKRKPFCRVPLCRCYFGIADPEWVCAAYCNIKVPSSVLA